MNCFPHIDIRSSCKLTNHFDEVKHENIKNELISSATSDQTSSQFLHQNMIRRLAAVKRQENNKAASFWLSMTSEKHRFFGFMTTLCSDRLFEYAILQGKGGKWWEKVRYAIDNSFVLYFLLTFDLSFKHFPFQEPLSLEIILLFCLSHLSR